MKICKQALSLKRNLLLKTQKTMENLILADINRILNQYKIGYKDHHDQLFTDCNHYIKPFTRLGVYSSRLIDEPDTLDDDDENHENQIVCDTPGCNIEFNSIDEYNVHYNSQHKFRCSYCKKVLPSGHLLDLHLLENHDTFFEVQSQKKAMYSCFVEECTHKCMNQDERRDHCIMVHSFPHNFHFDKINRRHKTTSTSSQSEMYTNNNNNNNSNNNNNNAVDSMETNQPSSSTSTTFKPNNLKNFHFGHNKVKTFAMPTDKFGNKKSKKSKNKSVLEDNQMVTDLMESLPD